MATKQPATPVSASAFEGSRPGSALLRMPLYYKLTIANGAIALLAIFVCAMLVATAARSDPAAGPARVIWPIALVAFALGVVVNALVVHVALKPLRNLAEAAARVRDGAIGARAEETSIADTQTRHLIGTFNGMLDHVDEYRTRLREIAIRAIDAGEAERLRISRELHDGIAQSLAAVLIQQQIARSAGPDDAAALLAEASGQLTSTINELRLMAQELRPPALDMIGLSAAILAHARNVSETTGIRLDARVEGVDGVLAPEAELAMYRLVQEAVLNVVRHSKSSEARVTVTRREGVVTAEVVDAGSGFDVDGALAAGGLGLFGMHERASYVGGRVVITSAAGTGTTVCIEIPFKEPVHG